jgi:formate hydrogenlyase subunit 5
VPDGVLLAERVEGIASVAHALAFCHAVERLADVTVPRSARLVRVLHAELERIANHLDVLAKLADAAGSPVLHAELERIANHLDVLAKLADAAGLAVATARFSLQLATVGRFDDRARPSARRRRPPAGLGGVPSNDKISEPADHGLGRSRGGLTTKVHARVDARGRP